MFCSEYCDIYCDITGLIIKNWVCCSGMMLGLCCISQKHQQVCRSSWKWSGSQMFGDKTFLMNRYSAFLKSGICFPCRKHPFFFSPCTGSDWDRVSFLHSSCCGAVFFVTRTVLITHWYFSSCWTVFAQHQDLLSFSLCLVSVPPQWLRGGTRCCEGYNQAGDPNKLKILHAM